MRLLAPGLLFFSLLWVMPGAYAEKNLNVGVLAFRDKVQTVEKWQPLIDYLDTALAGHHFALKVYTYKELEDAVEQRQVDFVLTHGAHYVQISAMTSLSSPLATVIERENDRPIPVYAGTIIVRADRNDITHLADLKGKTVATSSIQGFASYQMQAYELFKTGLYIPGDIKLIEVELPIDRSVTAILDGTADAAFARMGLVEQMVLEGKLTLGSVKVLNAQKLAGLGYEFSTTLYPLWPFAATPQVSDELAAKVATALLMLPHDGEVARACNIWGFTIPANYQRVKEVMQALRIPPFDEVPDISWHDLWQRYWLTISLALAAGFIILLLLLWLALSRRRLREGEERLSSVAESAPDAIILADGKGLIADWNKGAEQMFGYTREEVLGQPLTLLMPPRYRTKHSDGMQRIEAGASPHLLGQLLELEGLRKDGNEFPVELVLGSWITSSGRHFSAIIRDICERKRVARELDEYRHHLEDLVSQRTAELELAKNTAEAANRAKTVFLSNMSHELRTPLNAILGFTQIMAGDGRIPEDQQRNIAIVNRSGNHLLAVINDVLEISRIEAGRATVSRETFNLPTMLQSLREMMRSPAMAKGLILDVTLPDDLPTYVSGDTHHLRQVLLNLLGNAVKYTEQGQVCLAVSLQPDQMIRFEVVDTGSGISKKEQARLFEAFYQTETGIAKGEGTGLGLAISREFVRLMGGELSVESLPGQGSLFRFVIPLPSVEAAPQTAGIDATTTGQILGLQPGQSAPRILVAEDRPDNQQVVEELLKQIGCKVAIAANGRLAVELFESWRPHLILMDMRMPIMDGYQATQAIRRLPGGGHIPIIALTASAFREDRSRVLASGCNDMLSKPVDAQHLFGVIGRMLGLHYEYAHVMEPETESTLDDLRDLPVELRKELAQVALLLDSEAVFAVCERLRDHYPREVLMIMSLIRDFRFDKLLELYPDDQAET